ncbi:MAG TPA: ATP-binding protein [Oscillatoriaceae cyanobacterium M33_DOE_052]|uniref:ATP-binding protein n=1 Tax=Planktothricoides sp. SpSt-374 TaxID=2282167 RepID=A0A7C3ZJY7_9CYAN|nr:ATP-binding protein [Oscillatoriaceae cyanobacterium M33_DOE_052]
MVQIYGDFNQSLPDAREYLILGFYLKEPDELDGANQKHGFSKSRWRTNGLSANFLADYLCTFLPVDEDNLGEGRQREIKSAVSYIANELLENAMKYADSSLYLPITVKLQLYADSIVITTNHGVSVKQGEKLLNFIKNFTNFSTEDSYFGYLEEKATVGSTTESGLGFVTMMNYYNAKVGWELSPMLAIENTALWGYAVTTMVQLSLSFDG